jgi:hypothetical protein
MSKSRPQKRSKPAGDSRGLLARFRLPIYYARLGLRVLVRLSIDALAMAIVASDKPVRISHARGKVAAFRPARDQGAIQFRSPQASLATSVNQSAVVGMSHGLRIQLKHPSAKSRVSDPHLGCTFCAEKQNGRTPGAGCESKL